MKSVLLTISGLFVLAGCGATTKVFSLVSIAPVSGSISGGDTVTLLGTGFESGMTVTFGGSSASSVAVSAATSATCITPAHSSGAVDVAVTVGSSTKTLAGAFTYTATALVWPGTRHLGVFGAEAKGQAIARGKDDTLIVAGQTNSGLDGNTLAAGPGYYDAFVTKYDSAGAKVWTKQLGAAGDSTIAFGAAVDSSGNVFIGGLSKVVLDPDVYVVVGNEYAFVSKYSSAGVLQWSRQVGGKVGGGTITHGTAMILDSNGDAYLAGHTTAPLGGNLLTGTQDAVVIKVSSDGEVQWIRQLGVSTKASAGYGISTDGAGYVYVAGTATGALPGNVLTGAKDFFVAKYRTSGKREWLKQLGAATATVLDPKVTADGSGNSYVAGNIDAGLDGNSLIGTYDTFLTKYNSDGVKQWTRQSGEAANTVTIKGIAMDPDGNAVLTGTASLGLDGIPTIAGVGQFDGFVMKYNGSGVKQWTRLFGVALRNTFANSIVTDSESGVYVAGEAAGGLDGFTLTGNSDFFAIKYDKLGTKK